MIIFCWLIPIGLLVSCSANDNVLPTYSSPSSSSGSNYSKNLQWKFVLYNFYLIFDHCVDGEFVTNYLKSKNKKIGLLSGFRYLQENYLPQTQSRKAY